MVSGDIAAGKSKINMELRIETTVCVDFAACLLGEGRGSEQRVRAGILTEFSPAQPAVSSEGQLAPPSQEESGANRVSEITLQILEGRGNAAEAASIRLSRLVGNLPVKKVFICLAFLVSGQICRPSTRVRRRLPSNPMERAKTTLACACLLERQEPVRAAHQYWWPDVHCDAEHKPLIRLCAEAPRHTLSLPLSLPALSIILLFSF